MDSSYSDALARDTRRLALVVGTVQAVWVAVWVVVWAGDHEAAPWFGAPLVVLGVAAVAGWVLVVRGSPTVAFGVGLLALALSLLLALAGWATGDAGGLGVLLAAAQAATAFPLVLLAVAAARRTD